MGARIVDDARQVAIRNSCKRRREESQIPSVTMTTAPVTRCPKRHHSSANNTTSMHQHERSCVSGSCSKSLSLAQTWGMFYSQSNAMLRDCHFLRVDRQSTNISIPFQHQHQLSHPESQSIPPHLNTVLPSFTFSGRPYHQSQTQSQQLHPHSNSHPPQSHQQPHPDSSPQS